MIVKINLSALRAKISGDVPVRASTEVPTNQAPTALSDVAETDSLTAISGNVLANDVDWNSDALAVVAVNGVTVAVGEDVIGSSGGLFNIAEDGSWTFDPNGEFTESAETSVSYTISDGPSFSTSTLTVTVTVAE